jgi:hypothetical protein
VLTPGRCRYDNASTMEAGMDYDSETIEHALSKQQRRPQMRLSHDGVAWEPWQDLVSLEDQVPAHGYAQARCWKENHWLTSPVFACP